MRFLFQLRQNLTVKLSVLVTVAVLLVLLVLGGYFDVFLRDVFLQSTRTRMQHAFQRLLYNEGRIEQALKESAGHARTDEKLVASAELINKYQDKTNYNAFLIDEEKKTLASELLNRVKLSFNSDIALYGETGELIAYACLEPGGYQLGYLSYAAGQPVRMAREERHTEFKVAQVSLPCSIALAHVDYYSQEQLEKSSIVTFHRQGDTLAIKGHQSVVERATGRLIAHLELTHRLDQSYFNQLSKDLDIDLRQSFVNTFGVESGSLQQDLLGLQVFPVKDQYVSVLAKEVIGGTVYYAVASDRSMHNAVINSHRLQFLVLLVVLGAGILTVMRHLIRRSLAQPLDQLMLQIRKIEKGDYASSPTVATGDELQEISTSVDHLATVVKEREASLEGARHEQEYLSNHDSLTGLSNRRFFSQRLEHALDLARRQHSQLAVLFLDLDQFKLVNDTLGHGVGDALLVQVGERLKNAARASDTLARIGGDEFNVLLEHVSDVAGVEVSVAKFLNLFREPFVCGEHRISTTVSIGVALYPKDGADSTTLLKSADLAVYKAKDGGRDRYSFYSEDLSQRARLRAKMIHALHEAIQVEGQFKLVYQPKVSARSGEVKGAEALLRWNSPVFGNVPPMDFIPLAEETGQILGIGDWVVRQGCRDMAAMQAQGIRLEHLSLNVSNVQMRGRKLLESLLEAVERWGLQASHIELEVTESYIASDTAQAITTLHEFRAAGFLLAIDDFGTGYSSMSYLQKLPFTRLKIDKSFIDGLPLNQDSVSITRAILGLGKNFGLALTAEGVERADQLKFLRQEGCDEIQGYYFSRPLPFEEFVAYCRNSPRPDPAI
ncbi:MAG: EAL domain-containing protein [Rhodoferax sp.]|nr:EAL domain-containing protein [Rhodoferax sp.]